MLAVGIKLIMRCSNAANYECVGMQLSIRCRHAAKLKVKTCKHVVVAGMQLE